MKCGSISCSLIKNKSYQKLIIYVKNIEGEYMDNNYSLDLSSIPRELKLLLEIMKTENDDRYALFKNEWFTDIDWELFLQLSRHHRVYPVIYSKLKKMDQIEFLHMLFKRCTKNTRKIHFKC